MGRDRDAGVPHRDDVCGPRVRRRCGGRDGRRASDRRGRRGDTGRRRVRRQLAERPAHRAGRAGRRAAGHCRRDRVGGRGPGSGGRRHRNGLLRLEGRYRQLEPRDRRPYGRCARARELRRRRRPADRRRVRGPPPPPAEPRSQPGRQLHRGGGHRRAARVAQLARVARRAGLGLARTGSVAHHGSGEIFVAFSTTARVARGGAPRQRFPTATSTRSSSPPSTPPRRRC